MDLNAEVDNLVKASQAWIPMIMEYGSRVLLAVITLAIGWWLINSLTQKVGKLLALRNADQALQGFISSLANVILKVLLIVSVASMIGVETTSFVAAIGAAGLAIGLALQGSLANFAGGVLILLFRPFRIGDVIEAQGISGTVDSIQIFHTVLRTGDNKTVIVPNGNLSNGIITNHNRQLTRKVIFDVGVNYEADLQKAREVLLDLAKDERVLADPEPVAVVSMLGDSAITLSLRVWVKTADYWDVMFRFNELSRDRLKEAGIDIPFPQRVIRVVQEAAV
ncbi:Small-conductance mechanosensitive channel [Pseudomonas chlororaphis subsp. aurantiaca]|jgi:small conductance mechanosensitive channel|uniref:Small-conductance mechanosensitive channel n=3 Tax=Pseudomonas chlororaphis TaxID=587753 RepID=A0AAQ1FA96_9PSED|nr:MULTISPECIES: mechanosensitive ion channel family protein [Pseudomonas]AIS11514.1 mechanosensitive ion channel protein MscS [Pseudomonas chlororaphis subsp. aurantiaca]AUG42709.1 mechanosensitive ion channel family protein [Pseudomonas chlororaphis]AZC32996.1 Small-conductance mechanosensitive channel [Pseudomonas chlororaphis subsp. piscium]AZD37701.1 Small-conductance mechanosensitive channel [Pseudomonas chlororaphis subsp. aurantiaca]AZD44040.1 Small-conductance mechanosensitive channel